MIKLFISSFDNTLIDEEEAIPTSTMFELDRVKQKGIKFCVITNRLPEDVLYYNQDYPFIDYIIALNGGILLDVVRGKLDTFQAFTKKELGDIFTQYGGKKILFYTKDAVSTDIPQEPVYKIEIQGTKKVLIPNVNSSIFQKDKEKYLEISKNTVWDALSKIKENEMLAVIGNESEEILFEKIPKTYVVRNAPKSLKDKAKRMTKSNKQKGVEIVLKEEIK